MKKTILAVALAGSLTGCFTLYQSEFPEVATVAAPNENIGVQLAGFEATVTSYTPIYTYGTTYGGGWGGPWGRYHGFVSGSSYTTQTYIPQTEKTTAFIDRATESLERAGYVLKTEKPDYRIEVKFGGPTVTDGDTAVEWAWRLLSAFSAEYGVQTWTAKLNIYDLKTGKIVMFHDYAERYQAVVWGPIPLFSPFGSDRTSYSTMQSWCLTALTDRVVADASAFLASR